MRKADFTFECKFQIQSVPTNRLSAHMIHLFKFAAIYKIPQTFMSETLSLPHQLCNKYGSVCTIWLANKPVIILSGYQAIKDALVTQGEEFNGRAQYPLLVRSTNGFGESAGRSYFHVARE